MYQTIYQERLRLGGTHVVFETAGRGRPLVCIHGNYASKRWFTEQLSHPPEGWRVVAPDLPNFGESGALAGAISIEAYADIVKDFLDALELSGAVLLGHSLGGAVAQVVASRYPERLGGLVLVASAPPGGLYGSPGQPLKTRLPEGLKLPKGLNLPKMPNLMKGLSSPDLRAAERMRLERALRPLMPAGQPPYFDDLVDDALLMRREAVSAHLQALAHYDTANLATFAPPVLIVHGQRDTIIRDDMARATQAAFRRAELKQWSDVGHCPQFEVPGRFNRLLGSYLKAHF